MVRPSHIDLSKNTRANLPTVYGCDGCTSGIYIPPCIYVGCDCSVRDLIVLYEWNTNITRCLEYIKLCVFV